MAEHPHGRVYLPYDNILDKPHTLISGCTGSGKSTLLHGLITTLLYRPYNTRMILIDPKRVELSRYKKLPHVLSYAWEIEEIIFLLKSVNIVMDKRYERMEKQGITQSTECAVYVIIDEFAVLMQSKYRYEFIENMQRLLCLARASNIHIICATQNPSRKNLDQLPQNFTERVGLRCQNAIESRQIINQKGCESLPQYGKALYLSEGRISELKIVKIDDEENQRLIDYWLNRKAEISGRRTPK